MLKKLQSISCNFKHYVTSSVEIQHQEDPKKQLQKSILNLMEERQYIHLSQQEIN